MLGLVGGKEVIIRSVFSDDYDDVLDGGAGGFFLLGLKSADERTTEAELKHGHSDKSDAQTVQTSRNDLLQGHPISSSILDCRGGRAQRDCSAPGTERW